VKWPAANPMAAQTDIAASNINRAVLNLGEQCRQKARNGKEIFLALSCSPHSEQNLAARIDSPDVIVMTRKDCESIVPQMVKRKG